MLTLRYVPQIILKNKVSDKKYVIKEKKWKKKLFGLGMILSNLYLPTINDAYLAIVSFEKCSPYLYSILFLYESRIYEVYICEYRNCNQ